MVCSEATNALCGDVCSVCTFFAVWRRHSTLCGVVTIGTDTVVILPRVNITGYGGLLSTGVTYYVKSTFRAYIVVISSTVSAFINLLISLVVVLIFMIINGVEFRLTILLFPLIVVELYVFALAVAFLLRHLVCKVSRHRSYIWDVVMQIWFYITPIIYPLSQIISMSGFGLVVAKLMLIVNPMAQIIQDARYVLVTTQTETIWNTVGAGTPLLKNKYQSY